ncbi:O-methyltransferase [Chromobacterium subtsugae]|uniref:O-methyltransferase n=1 Tax=Chromobacterium subtsugae TaxID=251747 RepID=A0ABS7FA82_9NEIS|nr:MULTISPECIES: class I SAM-dependent methyltransferase [Chromobacterium]KUM01778.1 methyltransferase [Chromobacterium subtsugae]KZE83261.1 methyltransferase [Chromobacterium sp. F49]MBW7567228.1 class I SAM-dependent methyltransferase [Chromobacterium subtsugae]MBW8286198.1 O-methyltransferase [Chromobacterium subtsugae]OBU87893.1 methyltransferase [Chromobacterium subtsugae]
MTSRTVALDRALHDYLFNIGVAEHPVQRELREFTAGHRLAKMQIAPEQGQFMGWLARLIGARRYLEIGVFTGYSALTVALAMPEDGEVVACDVSDTFTAIAREYWAKAGVAGRIDLRLQPALNTLQTLLDDGRAGSFDLAFIDADKPSYRDYYEACLQLVRPGGVIAIDNIFLSGRVVAPKPEDPPGVHLVHAFNASLKADPRVHMCVLPVGDGLTLCTRR